MVATQIEAKWAVYSVKDPARFWGWAVTVQARWFGRTKASAYSESWQVSFFKGCQTMQ